MTNLLKGILLCVLAMPFVIAAKDAWGLETFSLESLLVSFIYYLLVWTVLSL